MANTFRKSQEYLISPSGMQKYVAARKKASTNLAEKL